MLAKFISLNAVIRGYICIPIWRALKSVSHSNLLFLATLLRQASELESKNLRISVSTTHDCVSKKKTQPRSKEQALLVLFFFRGGSWQHKLLTTSYSSPPGANDTASQADGVAPVLHHQSSPVIKSGG